MSSKKITQNFHVFWCTKRHLKENGHPKNWCLYFFLGSRSPNEHFLTILMTRAVKQKLPKKNFFEFRSNSLWNYTHIYKQESKIIRNIMISLINLHILIFLSKNGSVRPWQYYSKTHGQNFRKSQRAVLSKFGHGEKIEVYLP